MPMLTRIVLFMLVTAMFGAPSRALAQLNVAGFLHESEGTAQEYYEAAIDFDDARFRNRPGRALYVLPCGRGRQAAVDVQVCGG